jgi:predicted NBD/HSP70 family sugar kinase
MRPAEHDHNKLRLLKAVRRTPSISRIELAAALGLTKGTVTELSAALLRRGVIVEEEAAPGGRGRPRTGLHIAAGAAHALGLFPMFDGTVLVEIIDMTGERIASHRATIGGLGEVGSLAGRLADAVEDAIACAPIARDTLRHVGIVLPGQVDRRAGILHWLPAGGVHDPVAIGPLVEARIGIPVTLDNRATVVARAEHWFGHPGAGDLDNFTLIALLEMGMGGARYADGALQTGYNGMNSEYAHAKVAFDGGRACFCGGTGCLAAYASVAGIVAGLAGQGAANERTIPALFEEAVVQAQAGDAAAKAAFDTAGRALGSAVAGHVNADDPGRVVIATASPDLPALLAPAFEVTLAAQILPALRARTRIAIRPIAPNSLWQGAASLALEQLYRMS